MGSIFNENIAEKWNFGSMNSARMHCSWKIQSNVATEYIKKKAKRERTNAPQLSSQSKRVHSLNHENMIGY